MTFGYDLSIYRKTGLLIPISHDIDTYCHVLLTGASGSGKSYGLIYLIGNLLKNYPRIKLWFCDFKNSEDFKFLKDYPFYFSGNNCYDGIMEYYNEFTNSREKSDFSSRNILICDEYPALINYLSMKDKRDKTKYANEILSAIAEILCMGRGIHYYVWIVTQRADSTLFNNGSRDNFMVVIALSRLSKEQKGMLFSGEDIPDTLKHQGEGIILSDGHALREIKIPRIADITDWNMHIRDILDRQGCS